MKRVLVAALLGLPLAATAQERPTIPQSLATNPAKPCAHGSSSIQIGGMDLDELKCRLVLDEQQMTAFQSQLLWIEAKHFLTVSDLEAEKKAAEQRQKDLDKWFKEWFGTDGAK
jgi:hypothetical protein